jgi:hypothetical protein
MVMEEAGSSGTLIPTYQTPQRYNPEDSNLDQYLLLISPTLWTMMLITQDLNSFDCCKNVRFYKE